MLVVIYAYVFIGSKILWIIATYSNQKMKIDLKVYRLKSNKEKKADFFLRMFFHHLQLFNYNIFVYQ